MVTWFWSIYTTAITIGAITSKNLPGYVFALLAAPSAILILAYWMTVRAQMPAEVRFDPRSPDDIQKAFSTGMVTKKKALSLALLFSLLAAIVVGAGLFTIGTQRERKPTPPPPPPAVADFTAVQQVVKQRFVRVTGVIPDANTARVVITSVEPKPTTAVVVLAPVGNKNIFVCNVPVEADMKKYFVAITWVPTDKSERTIVKSF